MGRQDWLIDLFMVPKKREDVGNTLDFQPLNRLGARRVQWD